MKHPFINQRFCTKWQTTADITDNQYCRKCPSQPCQQLWLMIKKLASSNDYEGIEAKTLSAGHRFRLFTTPRQGEYRCSFQVLESYRVGNPWGISKEDFMYVLKTGDDHTPSQTRQKSHVESIISYLKTQKTGKELISQILKQ
jgi:hypothetical protein